MILFLQNNEFLDGFATGYGARLAIHAQETKSVPLDDGVFISAASETNIGLTKVCTSILFTVKFNHLNDILYRLFELVA